MSVTFREEGSDVNSLGWFKEVGGTTLTSGVIRLIVGMS